MTAFTFLGSEMTKRSAVSSSVPPSLKLDEDNDVLYVSVPSTGDVVESIFDDEEIFVFMDAQKRGAAFVIPYYQSYWLSRIDALVAHLEKYSAGISRYSANLYAASSSSAPTQFLKQA